MGLYRNRLRRLEGITAVQEELWSEAAVARLTDRELHLLHDALQDPKHAFGPEEQAALERYNGFLKEARRGV
jgi:hypothetical protein